MKVRVKYKGKWIKAVVIKENGILVYKNHFCKCGCGKRLPYKETQERNGLPYYIRWHYFYTDEHKEAHKELWLGSNNPNVINPKYGEDNPFYGKKHTKQSKLKDSINRTGKCCGKDNPNYKGKSFTSESYIKISKARKAWNKKHPDKVAESINRMNNATKNNNTNPEVIVQEFLSDYGIKYFTHKYIRINGIITIPDILIPKYNTIIYVDGCFHHGCEECFGKHYYIYDVISDVIVNKDNLITKMLTMAGVKVIRIWSHNIDNNKFKKMLRVKLNLL